MREALAGLLAIGVGKTEGILDRFSSWAGLAKAMLRAMGV